jgi:Protein of unknown function (DUF2855)
VSDFLIARDDLRICRVAEADRPELENGQALLRVDSFGLSSNNITYAVFGEGMSYWRFFPAQEGWGRLPVWGFAEVEHSEAEGIEPGARVYGYLPASNHLVVAPERTEAGSFVDASPHRAELPAVYQLYTLTAGDVLYRPETEDIQMLLRPLFTTSFLIDDQLADEGHTARGPIVISSASSKTAIATAFRLSEREEAEVVGLTSARNLGFVDGLGIYERCVPYEEIGSLERRPSAYVDISGDGGVRMAVHSHFGDELALSMTVGVTHWEEMAAGQGELPGPPPVLFFAPDRMVKRAADWGMPKLHNSITEAWNPFCEWVAGWLEVERGEGFDAVERVYRELLEGQVEPQTAHVLTL